MAIHELYAIGIRVKVGKIIDQRTRCSTGIWTSLVSKGALYLPSVLNYATPPFCMLQKDHLIQHWIQDEHGHLIPPWEMSNELRPGSLVAVVAAICERNTLCNGPECEYFERVCPVFLFWSITFIIVFAWCLFLVSFTVISYPLQRL